MVAVSASCVRQIGRYQVFGELGTGGMATVHFGRLVGEAGFARTVAIKRLHPHLAKDQAVARMFVDEARVAARIRHPNVVPTIDSVAEDGELLLVMEFVLGESLAGLLDLCAARGERLPPPVAVRICADALYGLDAAHRAVDVDQEPLRIVHRDVSPQNILVGSDGMARLLDFGIARATLRAQTTRDGHVKGKLGYMAPEQLLDRELTARTDLYALAVVLWEALTAERLFAASNEGAVVAKILEGVVVHPKQVAPEVPQALGDVVMRGLERDPARRFASAQEMAAALEAAMAPATPREVSDFVRRVAGSALAQRSAYVDAMDALGPDGAMHVAEPAVTSPRAAEATVTDVPVRSASPRSSPDPGRRRTLTWIASAAVLGAIATLGLVRLRREPAVTEPAPPAEALAPSFVLAAPAPPPPVESADPPPTVKKTTTVPTRAPPPAKRTTPATHPKRVAPASSCDPPYVEDATGIRRIKPGCL